LTATIAAAALLFAWTGTSFAQGFHDLSGQDGTYAASGVAGMLRLRIPFGAGESRPSRPELLFSLATEWRESGSPHAGGGLRYVQNFDAGLGFDRTPVLRLGAIDVARGDFPRLSAVDGGARPEWFWWAAGVSIALVVVSIALLAQTDDFPQSVQ
jgi:hypothetical protein